MDFVSAVKSDVLTAILTFIVPGAFALAPYLVVTGHYRPEVAMFWDDHPTAFPIIITLVVILVGVLLEEIGTRVEVAWDKRLAKRGDSNWEAYLKLRVGDEIVGQRYLRRILTRMKFELSMIFAIPLSACGFIWLNALIAVWEPLSLFFLCASMAVITAYLTWESYQSAGLLHRTRQLIIDAVAADPATAQR